MKARPIIAFLLALVIAQAATVPPASAQEESQQAEVQELKLTPEEEREVRATVARFSERLRATNDFGQIIDEMFVQDFSKFLWRELTGQLPWAYLDKNLIAYASSDTLRRYYVASMNFYDAFFRATEIFDYQKKQPDNGEDKSRFNVLSREVVDVLLSDPTLAVMGKELREEYENERTQEDEGRQPAENSNSSQAAGATSQADDGTEETSEIEIIKNHWQLSGVTTTFEKANELMRKRLASLPPLPPPSSEETKSQPEPPAIDVSELSEGEYGYPKGTRIASVKQLPFYISLTKVEGHFRILNVAIYVD